MSAAVEAAVDVLGPLAERLEEAADLRVTLKNGRTLSAKVERCIGAAGVPIPDEELSRKTQGQLDAAYAPAVAAQILQQAWAMASAPRADAFCALLRQVR